MAFSQEELDKAVAMSADHARRQAFQDMRKHAEAVILGASNHPRPIYDMFMKAIESAHGGRLPDRPSLSFAERRFIAREFIAENGADLFKE